MTEEISQVDEKKVGFMEKCGYLGFSTSLNICYNFKSIYYLSFLTMVLHIDILWASIMVTLGTVWDAINDPLIGLFCTNHKFKNGEKIRPYALWCAVPWSASLVLLFVNFHLTQSWTIIVGLIVYFIFEALYTFLCMPYNSLASLATKSDTERNSINAFRSLGGCLGSGIGAVAILPIVKLFGGLNDHDVLNESDSKAIIYTALVMGVICIVGSLFHYFTAKERIKNMDESEEKIGLLKAFKMLFKCKSWILNMFFILCYGIISTLVMQNINYYAAYVYGNSNIATPILAGYLVVAIITSIIGPKLDKVLGRKKLMIIAIAVQVIGKIPFVINPYSIVNIIINAVTMGFGSTITFIVFNTNRNNIADILEVQNGRRIDALVSTGDNLIGKLAEAGAVQLAGIAFTLAKFVSDLPDGATQPQSAINTLNAFIGWVPGLLTLAMLFFILKMDLKKELQEAQEKNNSYINKEVE